MKETHPRDGIFPRLFFSWRILACALVLAALTNLPGCGTPDSSRLTFMVGGAPNEIAFWESILADFAREHHIPVTMIRQSTDTDQRKQGILLALRGRHTDPDVLLLDVAWIGQMAASNWLEPLNEYKIDTTPFFPGIIRLADTYREKTIGLPLYVDGGMLYYRKDLLTAHGVDSLPATWDELIGLSETIQADQRKTDPDFWGFVWQGAQYEGLICNALEFFTSANGGFFSETGKPVFTQPGNIRALQLMHDLIKTRRISPPNTFTDMKEEEVRLMFQNGHALFERNWPYAWGLHNAEDSAVKGLVGMCPLPRFPDGKNASTLGGWHIAVSRFSDRKAEAVKFLQYVTSFAVQKNLSLTLGWNSGRTDVYDDPEVLAANPAAKDLKEIFTGAVPRPVVPYYSAASSILQKYLSAALAGRSSPADALGLAQQEVEALLKGYGIE
jgi:multiple sugar transport system substrate-binding protein